MAEEINIEELEEQVIRDMHADADLKIFNEYINAFKEMKLSEAHIKKFKEDFQDYADLFGKSDNYDNVRKLLPNNTFIKGKEIYLDYLREQPLTDEEMEIMGKRFRENLEKKIKGVDFN